MVDKLPTRILGRTNIKVPIISLGTTVIGFVYGIGPRELPTETEVIDFLHQAVDYGIRFIDTAPYYGLAEERIGKSGITKMPGVIVSTKCGHILDKGGDISDDDLAKSMRFDVESSLKKLKLDHLELVQVHGGTPERIRNGSIINIMQKLKDEGKVRFVGISTRGEDMPLAVIESGFFDTLQLAYSIPDQRMAVRVFDEAKKHNIGVINRSVLLKGVLTEASRYLTPSLAPLKKSSDDAKMIAERMGMTLPALAIRFALSNDLVHTVLLGTRKFVNLNEAIDATIAGPLQEDGLLELKRLTVHDLLQVDPKNWPYEITADMKNHKK